MKATLKELLEIVKALEKRIAELELAAFHSKWASQLKYKNKDDKK
jgi:exonuclease VII small subunit